METTDNEIIRRTDSVHDDADGMPIAQRVRSMRLGHIEATLSSLYGSVNGGVFIFGLLRIMHAGDIVFGLIGAIPFFAQMATSGGSYLVQKGMTRRRVALSWAGISRIMWLPLLAAYLIFRPAPSHATLIVFVTIGLAIAMMGGIGQTPWLSWMTDIVPLERRGRYFGRRNAIVGMVTILSSLIGGKFIDANFGLKTGNPIHGYVILFAVGMCAGLLGLIFMSLMNGGGHEKRSVERPPFRDLIRIPMRDANFKRYVLFQCVWMTGVQLSAPFCAVIMLRELDSGVEFVALVTSMFMLAGVLTNFAWGVLADKFGNKPVMIFCTLFSSSFPLWWFFVSDTNYWIFLMIYYFLAGAMWAGYTLASSNLMLRLSPAENNSAFLGLFNTASGVTSALAPVVGGSLSHLFMKAGLGNYVWPLLGVFFISSTIRYSSVRILASVREPDARPVKDMLKAMFSIKEYY